MNEENLTLAEPILAEFVTKYGLPREVGARGWITQQEFFKYEDENLGYSEQDLKGWIYLNQRDEDEDQENYYDLDSLLAVIQAFTDDSTDETMLDVSRNDDTVSLSLKNDEADGKSWSWIGQSRDEDEMIDLAREVMEYDEDTDDHDISITDFLYDHCEMTTSEESFSLSYGVAWVEWANGAKLGIRLDTEFKLVCFSVTLPE